MNPRFSPFQAVALALVLFIGGFDTTVAAQSQARVLRDRTVIWRADVAVAAVTVPAGTTLEVVGQTGDWYVVVIPEQFGGHGERGRIGKTAVSLANADPAAGRAPDSVAAARSQAGRAAATTRTADERTVALRGFAQASYAIFSARKSFEAVFGDANAPSFGFGAQVRFRHGPFAEVSWERVKETGQRVFVFENTVYGLGVPNTVTITPLTVTGGYRLFRDRALTPYVGGGLSRYRLRQTTPFTTDAEDFEEDATGFHVTGGVEFRAASWMSVAAEVRYTSVRNILGGGGVSELFNEDDAGGVQPQIKVLIGR